MLYNKINIRNFATQQSKGKIKSKWKSVVGLEIHAQILSKSKLFSGAEVAFGAPVNSCVSNFDASVPGTLPVLNEQCVKAGIKTALALSCHINPISMFDRKHYFYADSPAGYQITQQRAPLANNGQIAFNVFVPGVTKKPYQKVAKLHQLQLEQDSGKSLHDSEAKKSLVDLNRAGVPLMELVFEPDLSNGEEAAALVRELILILSRLETCTCKMEEGALRVDANISVNRDGEPLGTRTEVKNIGSVRGVADAITYEIKRQLELVENDKIVNNETRSWDAMNKCTVAMRDKEVVQDYRFMPEPNLPPLHLNVNTNSKQMDGLISVQEIADSLPELPEQTRQKLIKAYDLAHDIAAILVNEEHLLHLFYDIIEENNNLPPKIVINFLINDLLMLSHKHKINIETNPLSTVKLAKLFEMLQTEVININLARLILEEMLINPIGRSPLEIAEQNNWKQIKDPQVIITLCKTAMAKNPKMVESYRSGKEKALFALAGEIVRVTENKANMSMVVDTLKNLLKS